MRYVIPTNVDKNSVAFQGKTWAELATEMKLEVENLGSQWCIDNHVNGLGAAVEYVPIPDPSPASKSVAEIAIEFATIESVADVEAFRAALEGLL